MSEYITDKFEKVNMLDEQELADHLKDKHNKDKPEIHTRDEMQKFKQTESTKDEKLDKAISELAAIASRLIDFVAKPDVYNAHCAEIINYKEDMERVIETICRYKDASKDLEKLLNGSV